MADSPTQLALCGEFAAPLESLSQSLLRSTRASVMHARLMIDVNIPLLAPSSHHSSKNEGEKKKRRKKKRRRRRGPRKQDSPTTLTPPSSSYSLLLSPRTLFLSSYHLTCKEHIPLRVLDMRMQGVSLTRSENSRLTHHVGVLHPTLRLPHSRVEPLYPIPIYLCQSVQSYLFYN